MEISGYANFVEMRGASNNGNLPKYSGHSERIEFHGGLALYDKALLTSFLLEEWSLKSNDPRINQSIQIFTDFVSLRNLDESSFKVLLLLEPEVVNPRIYQPRIMEYFDLVIPFSPWRARALCLNEWVYFPVRSIGKPENPFNERSRNLAIINANKFSSSPLSNYGLRRKCIRVLEKTDYSYDVYGFDWDINFENEFKKRIISSRDFLKNKKIISLSESLLSWTPKKCVYRGHAEDKFTTLKDYQFSIVIENQSDYVSEKLIDVLHAGAIPIYIGPKLDLFLPQIASCVFEVSKEQLLDTECFEKIFKDAREIQNRKENIYNLFSTNSIELESFNAFRVWREVSKIIMKK